MKDKARKITKAAEDLFIDRRFHEVTLDEVAQQAHVGKGTIYRYFDDKEDLYLKTLLAGLDELVRSLEEMAEAGDEGADLLDLARQHVQSRQQRRPLFALLRSEELRKAKHERGMWPQFKKRIKAIKDIYRSTIERGMAEGRYRSDMDAELLASFLMGMLRAGGRVTEEAPEDLAREAVAVLERGIVCEKWEREKKT